jgi:Protein of unknown function (DUF1573)
MRTAFLFMALLAVAGAPRVQAQGTPKIQFDQTVVDFGKTSQVETVSGVFRYRNVGDGTLKLEKPQPQCGCTVAGLKPDTLLPGETGELSFTLNLGRSRAKLEKRITVVSNDPQTPQTLLTVKADYVPLYDISPISLSPMIALGAKSENQLVTVTRSDGQPLKIDSIQSSKPWITTRILPVPGSNHMARISVDMTPDGTPRRFNEFLQVYVDGKTNGPASTVFIYGRLSGEITTMPESLYWSITDPAKVKAERPDFAVTRRITLRATNGKPFEVKNARSSIKGVNVELVTKKPGEAYELVARLAEVPSASLPAGEITVDTNVASQPEVKIPVTINVFNPPPPKK